jgi:hypothetical protein
LAEGGQASIRDPQQDRAELLAHLQTPAAFGGHDFGDWPPDQIAGGFGGDLHARHRHDHTRLAHEFSHTHPDLQRDAKASSATGAAARILGAGAAVDAAGRGPVAGVTRSQSGSY